MVIAALIISILALLLGGIVIIPIVEHWRKPLLVASLPVLEEGKPVESEKTLLWCVLLENVPNKSYARFVQRNSLKGARVFVDIIGQINKNRLFAGVLDETGIAIGARGIPLSFIECPSEILTYWNSQNIPPNRAKMVELIAGRRYLVPIVYKNQGEHDCYLVDDPVNKVGKYKLSEGCYMVNLKVDAGDIQKEFKFHLLNSTTTLFRFKLSSQPLKHLDA